MQPNSVPTTSVRIYQTYLSGLGDTLFPDQDHESRILNSAVGELLSGMIDAGIEISQFNISEQLASFVPQQVQGATGDWKTLIGGRWVNEQKPRIFKAIGEFFLDGGMYTRLVNQLRLISDLEALGIEVVGAKKLFGRLVRLGNWHGEFVNTVAKGRALGIALRAKSPGIDYHAVSEMMRAAGFSHEQVQFTQCEIRESSAVAPPVA